MDLTRILSKRGKKREEALCRMPMERELEAYLELLVTELNLRLCLELEPEVYFLRSGKQEIQIARRYGQMLWVESAVLSSYEDAKQKPARGWRRILNFLRNI